jgi:MYXO-CTERM domain-containing protein
MVLLFAPALARGQTVDDVVARIAGGCTTEGTEGLSQELVRSHLCAFPGAVAEFTPHPSITLTHPRVHPLGTSETVAAIRAAADRTPLVVTSAFRTLVEQYLLYEGGGCGLAAVPGNSNHQSGLAVDLSNWEAARSSMLAAGCTHPYPTSDPVHFDCPGSDMRSASVLVFQRLWNVAHPEDRIAEDGVYGPMTRARLGRSPAAGFGLDLCPMNVARFGAELVESTFEGTIVLAPGEERVGTIELRNVGSASWDGSTRLATTEPRDRESAFAGPDWVAPNRLAAVEGAVPPGETYPFTFTLRAPATPGSYVEHVGLVQEGEAWFSDPDQLGPPDDAIALRITVLDEASTDAGVPADAGPGRGMVSTGCGCRAASPGSSSLVWIAALVLLALLARRRTRR